MADEQGKQVEDPIKSISQKSLYIPRIGDRHFAKKYGGREVREIDEMFAKPADYPAIFISSSEPSYYYSSDEGTRHSYYDSSDEDDSPKLLYSLRTAIILNTRNPSADGQISSGVCCPRRMTNRN